MRDFKTHAQTRDDEIPRVFGMQIS